MLRPPDAVDPRDGRIVIQFEAPVRRLAGSGFGGVIRLGEGERGAVVNRRQAPAQRDLALQIQLLRGLVAAIGPALGHQPGEFTLIQGETRGLALFAIRMQPQPRQIRPDRLDVILAAAGGVGIVDAQQEVAVLAGKPGLAGDQPVVQRRADVADVKQPGGAGGEAGYGGHGWGYRKGKGEMRGVTPSGSHSCRLGACSAKERLAAKRL